MHWIIENCKTVRAADGVTVIVDALKLLSVKHEKITYVRNCFSFSADEKIKLEAQRGARRSITEADLQRLNEHPSSRQQWIDEVQAEISMCLGMLYPIMEVFRNDDEFAEELSAYIFTACVVKLDGLASVRSDHGAALAHTFLPNVGKPQRQEREELSSQEGVPMLACSWVVPDPL